jgi:Leucine-rich repeat (LRR) protein
MIRITLNDGTKINYNTFDEIVDYCKHRIIKLNCYENYLTSLPNSIGNLTNLTYLYCGNNNLTSLPDSIDNLTNLTLLNCDSNELITLPDSICNLTNLKELVFFNTYINTLPDSIINLRNIIIIDDIKNKTPQQQRYYDWIKSGKIDEFDEYYDDFLIKSALKCY